MQKALLKLIVVFLTLKLAAAITLEGEGCAEYKPLAKEIALTNLLKKACAYGGVDIKSLTRVQNLTLKNFLILKRCSSKVKISNLRYSIDLSASRGNQICIKATARIVQVKNRLTDYGLNITLKDPITELPKYVVTEGEILKVELSTKKPCYAYVFEISPKSFVGRLIPTEGVKDNQIYLKGKAYFYYKTESYYRKYPQNWNLLFVCAATPISQLRQIPTFKQNLRLGYFHRYTYRDLEYLLFKLDPSLWDFAFTSFQIASPQKY
jgi:hypothetical protein